MSPSPEQRLARIAVLARTVKREERKLARAIEAARARGVSLRAIEQASGLSRSTIARQFEPAGGKEVPK